jgi:hypothetical protein
MARGQKWMGKNVHWINADSNVATLTNQSQRATLLEIGGIRTPYQLGELTAPLFSNFA